jgi:hypothetical protein
MVMAVCYTHAGVACRWERSYRARVREASSRTDWTADGASIAGNAAFAEYLAGLPVGTALTDGQGRTVAAHPTRGAVFALKAGRDA